MCYADSPNCIFMLPLYLKVDSYLCMLTEFLYFNSYDLNSSKEERDNIRTQKRYVNQLHLKVPNFQFINCITSGKVAWVLDCMMRFLIPFSLDF